MTERLFSCTMVLSAQATATVTAAPEQTLLNLAEQHLLAWPSSCRNGTCRTCIGQLRSGAVRYAIDWPGLSADEKAQGYVLPCVAYPTADVVLHR
jgi:ferredoxin